MVHLHKRGYLVNGKIGRLSAAAVVLGMMVPGSVIAADGDLDGFFSGDGVVVTPLAPTSRGDGGYATAVQWDGKIVVGGYADSGGSSGEDFAVVRLNTDGSLDTTFSGDGKVIVDIANGNDGLNTLAIQWDGKIIVGGLAYTGATTDYDFALVRLNTDGSLDSTFGGDGKVTTPVSTGSGLDALYDIALQPDGKIVGAGYAASSTGGYDFTVVRYNTDGTLDSTFSGDGIEMTSMAPGTNSDEARAIDLQADGKIVVAGSAEIGGTTYQDVAIVRYTKDGTPDSSFSGDGRLTVDIDNAITDAARAVVIQPNGRILIAVRHDPGAGHVFAMLRLMKDGSLDTTFGGDGIVTAALFGHDNTQDLALQWDGKIIMSGHSYGGVSTGYDSVIARFNADGSLDTTFSGDGKFILPIAPAAGDDWTQASAIQWDGKIVTVTQSMMGAGVTGYDLGTFRLNATTAVKTRASLTASTLLRRPTPNGATVKFTVAKMSRKVCAVKAGKLRTLKPGVCKATIAMTPKRSATMKKPKTTKVTVSFTVIG